MPQFFSVRRGSWQDLEYLLRSRIDFNASGYTLWGRHAQDVETNYGRLPSEWVDCLKADIAKGGVSYIVYSYATPIAWESNGCWIMPNVRYSVTTTTRQNKLRVAIDNLNPVEIVA